VSEKDSERDLKRIVRRLGVRDERLVALGDGGFRFGIGERDRTRERVSRELVQALRRDDLVTGPDEAVVLSAAGRSFLRRELAGSDAYRGQHQDLLATTVIDERGSPHQVVVDRNESPLSWLRNRRGRDGRPMIDAVEFAAGERLRSDFTRARMMPRMSANWSASIASGRRDGRSGGMADLTDAVIAARRRVERAIEAVGPELANLLLDFCCFLKGLEDIERDRAWPARSAKVVLRLGLSALARHYGLAAKARGPSGRVAIVHWGADDYRPELE
jgi:hypothetical protein